jgi:hypothetical protein
MTEQDKNTTSHDWRYLTVPCLTSVESLMVKTMEFDAGKSVKIF